MSQQVVAGVGGPWPLLLNESGTRQVVQPGALVDETGSTGIAVTATVGRLQPLAGNAALAAGATAQATAGRVSGTGAAPSLTMGQLLTSARGRAVLRGPAAGASIGQIVAVLSGVLTSYGQTPSPSGGVSALVTTGRVRLGSGGAPALSSGTQLTISPSTLALTGETATARADTAVPFSATAAAGRLQVRGRTATWSEIIRTRQSIAIGWPSPNFLNERGDIRQYLVPGQITDSNPAVVSQFATAARGRLQLSAAVATASLPALITAGAAARLATRGRTGAASVAVTAVATRGSLKLSGAAASVSAGASLQAVTGGVGTRSRPTAPQAGAFTTAFLDALVLQGLIGDAGFGAAALAVRGQLRVAGLPADRTAGAAAISARGRLAAAGMTGAVTSGRTAITAQLGAALLLGYAPTAIAGMILQTSLGSISLTGLLASAQIGGAQVVTATIGSLQVTGAVAEPSAEWFGDADPGTLSWFGMPAAAGAGAGAAVAQATFLAMRGRSARVAAGRTVTAATGSLAWQGNPVTLVRSSTAHTLRGALRLRGMQPSSVAGISVHVSAPRGGLIARGQMPTVSPAISMIGITRAMAIDARVRAMSQADLDPTLNPLPLDYGAMSTADSDKAFVFDGTAALTARDDRFVAVGAPGIWREDGDDLTAADLTAQNIGLLENGMQIGWTFTAGGNSAVYYAAFPLTLASGSRLTRTVRIAVLPAIG